MLSFGQKVINFNIKLQYSDTLPEGFAVLNPYHSNPETLKVMQAFYDKFYNDNSIRKFIIGINLSRVGTGVSGIPFTDTKRLKSGCGIEMESETTHDNLNVFMYDMIAAVGGAYLFYKSFYINSPFPLAIVHQTKNKGWVNANYYDEPKLFEAVKPFMIKSMKEQIKLSLDTDKVYILGKRNAFFINQLNKEAKLFDKAIILEHPRYI